MAVIEIAKIVIRRGQENQTGIPRLDPGEFGWAEDTENLYIGKRIAEGAVSDENSRILTEKDLNFFKLLAENTGTSASVYRYRSNAPYITSTSTTVQLKLDSDNPSLLDYGVTISSTATDITTQFNNAVQNLFYNSSADNWRRADARRKLLIPPGNYIIDQAIGLPPYTNLIGAGRDITVLTFVGTNSNLFYTVDALGNKFDSGIMQGGTEASRAVVIEGMTLQYANTVSNDHSLLSIDNCEDVSIRNVKFTTQYDHLTTTTYGIVPHGVGLELRGIGGSISAESTNKTKNIIVENCVFDGLNIGILGTGTVVRPIINDSYFTNLFTGITFSGTSVLPGPSNAFIHHNRFENIVNEGVYVGANYNSFPTNHVISENLFVHVANGLNHTFNVPILDDLTSITGTSIISLYADGNKSVDNSFNRRTVANSTSSASFYYNPLVNQKTVIDDSAIYTKDILTDTPTEIFKIPLTKNIQMAKVRYLMTTTSLTRAGELLVNIDPQGNSVITDTYNYSEDLIIDQTNVSITSTSGNTFTSYDLFFSNIQRSTISYYVISGTNSAYIDNVSYDGTVYTITTDPASTLDLTSISTVDIGHAINSNLDFTYQITTANNYVSVQFSNTSTIEYSVNLVV